MKQKFSPSAMLPGCVLLLGLMLGAIAQAAQPLVRGTIKDESGAVLPGVTVIARKLGTTRPRNVLSDSRGAYELSLVDAGEYEIQAVLQGFRSHTVSVTIAESEVRTIDFVLEIAPLAETVTVTRAVENLSEVPNAVAVIQGDDIQFAQRQVSPAEAFIGIPGLFAENRHNFSSTGGVRLSIRAPLTALRGLQIVQDGVPLTTADGTTQPTNLDLGSEGRVEIIRGPSSVLYGNSAGGVINLSTEFPSSERMVVQPDVQFGSFGYQRQQIKTEGTAGAVGYLLNVNRMRTDGFRTHSQADIRKVNMVIGASVSAHTSITGVLNYFDMPFAESPSTLNRTDALTRPTSVRQQAIDEGWGESSSQLQGGLTVEHRLDGGQVLRGTVWTLSRSVWNPIPSRVIDLGRLAAGFRSEYSGSRNVGSRPVDWITGLDISSQRDDRHEYQNGGVAVAGGRTRQGPLQLDQLEQVRSVAPFAQIGVAFLPRWRLTAGVRYDHYRFKATDHFLNNGDQSGDRTMQAFSPKVGITYAPTDRFNLYSNFATAYQTPTTVELSNRPTGEGGFNQDLDPATLRSVEIGARGLVKRLRLQYELAAYRSALENAFVPFQRPDQQTFYVNAGETTRNGTEALLEWTPVSRLKARLAYTDQDFTFKRFVSGGVDYAGRREPGAPPHQLFLGGSYETPFGLRSVAQLRWVDDYPVNNANTLSNWSYRVFDVRFGLNRKWKNMELRPFFGVDNLLDVRYNGSTAPNSVADRAFEPSPGRAFYVGLAFGVSAL